MPRHQNFSGRRLEQGWGVVYPAGEDHGLVRKALSPLLDLRASQLASTRGGSAFREFFGSDGVHPNESALQWLERHGVGPGLPDSRKVPPFLLLVGSPAQISFDFQANLGVQYYVGRLAFESPEQFHCYARAVVESESQGRNPRPEAVIVAPVVDDATSISHSNLISPLIRNLRKWRTRHLTGNDASKQRAIEELSRGGFSLFFAAAHCLGPGLDRRRELDLQGALITSDWSGKIDESLIGSALAARDLPPELTFNGTIFFLFGCFTAGTIYGDEYTKIMSKKVPIKAPHSSAKSFIASLPKKLLASGALAIIGHVGMPTVECISWRMTGSQSTTILAVVGDLMKGEPAGMAMHALTKRYAELAAAFVSIKSKAYSKQEREQLKRDMLDAKYFLLLGDPAVRLPTNNPSS